MCVDLPEKQTCRWCDEDGGGGGGAMATPTAVEPDVTLS